MLKKLLQMQGDALLLPELLEILDTDGPVNRFAAYAEPFTGGFEKSISEIPTHEWQMHLIPVSDDSPLLFAIIANSCVEQTPEGRRCQ
jgi:hypothetical protein